MIGRSLVSLRFLLSDFKMPNFKIGDYFLCRISVDETLENLLGTPIKLPSNISMKTHVCLIELKVGISYGLSPVASSDKLADRSTYVFAHKSEYRSK